MTVELLSSGQVKVGEVGVGAADEEIVILADPTLADVADEVSKSTVTVSVVVSALATPVVLTVCTASTCTSWVTCLDCSSA